MPWTFGNQPCEDPRPVYEYCRDHNLPTDWFGSANTFATGVGPTPGSAGLLMRYDALQRLNREALNDLTFTDDKGQSVTIKDLVFVRAASITPSYKAAPDSCFLLDVRDARHLAGNEFYSNPVNTMYNVLAPTASGQPQNYFAGSLNAGSPWTWQAMLNDLWNNWIKIDALGPAPTLPQAALPSSNPTELIFSGIPSWSVYNSILVRLGCGLVLDPFKSKSPSIVQLGAADAKATQAMALLANQRRLDDYPVESNQAKVASAVRVFFPRLTEQLYGAQETLPPLEYPVDVLAPAGIAGIKSGTVVGLSDDMPAIFDGHGNIQNLASLQTRANERAADYYRMVQSGGSLLHITYIGIQNNRGLLPGSQISGVNWRDYGGGYVTEIVRYPPGLGGGGVGSPGPGSGKKKGGGPSGGGAGASPHSLANRGVSGGSAASVLKAWAGGEAFLRSGGGGSELRSGGGTSTLTARPGVTFWAQITEPAGPLPGEHLGWSQIAEITAGNWAFVPGGLSSSGAGPVTIVAQEVNNTDVAVGTHVRLTLAADGQHYTFTAPGGGTGGSDIGAVVYALSNEISILNNYAGGAAGPLSAPLQYKHILYDTGNFANLLTPTVLTINTAGKYLMWYNASAFATIAGGVSPDWVGANFQVNSLNLGALTGSQTSDFSVAKTFIGGAEIDYAPSVQNCIEADLQAGDTLTIYAIVIPYNGFPTPTGVAAVSSYASLDIWGIRKIDKAG